MRITHTRMADRSIPDGVRMLPRDLERGARNFSFPALRPSRVMSHWVSRRRGFQILRHSQFQIEEHPFSPQDLAQRRPLDRGQDLGIKPRQPHHNPAVALPLFCFDQHLERRIFQVGHSAEVEDDDPWFCFSDQRPYLICYALGITEKNPSLHPQQKQTREKSRPRDAGLTKAGKHSSPVYVPTHKRAD